MSSYPLFCEQCAQAGVKAVASYAYQSEENSLEGPMMGDPDFWPPHVDGRRLLCGEHYADLAADSKLDYVPVDDCQELSVEMERISF